MKRSEDESSHGILLPHPSFRKNTKPLLTSHPHPIRLPPKPPISSDPRPRAPSVESPPGPGRDDGRHRGRGRGRAARSGEVDTSCWSGSASMSCDPGEDEAQGGDGVAAVGHFGSQKSR